MSATSAEKYTIRFIHAEEWPAVKELRLASLQDPLAHVAFLETYEQAVSRPDSFWQERAAGGAEGSLGVRQVIAEGADGTWVGSVTVLIEEAGSEDWAGMTVERLQGHLVGVYVRPEVRGSGLAERLFGVAVEWAWSRDVERVRLIVHEENPRAQAFYRKVGFVPSGRTVPVAGQGGQSELEFVLDRP
ncbi:GNAT family N-acetyltransferase [Streptomyces sp. HM190]|uniref:GNAT family N-acetyltransferase n=1 Tax=Streptomyces sp. HM190 TaxID=2695266 RepID=UPI001356C56E|nr:GNAT family N-acetyltransferase [Streptomyces sp. HM190]